MPQAGVHRPREPRAHFIRLYARIEANPTPMCTTDEEFYKELPKKNLLEEKIALSYKS